MPAPAGRRRGGEGQNKLTNTFPWSCPSVTPDATFLSRISQNAEAGSGPFITPPQFIDVETDQVG